MSAVPVAEILRVPLEPLCLRVRKLLADDTRPLVEVLAQAPCPPEPLAVARAVASLVGLGALHPGGSDLLTPLGHRLALLPIEPRLGKTLLCAAALGCLSPVALIVASLSAPRDPFGRGRAAGTAKRALDMTSDLLALVRAHGEWSAKRASCEALGVHGPTMKEVEQA
ncbi:unnamed protein product, partial [Polarella glacialis]